MSAALIFRNYYCVLMLCSFFLGAASVVYVGLRPAPIGFSFPHLNGEFVIRPAFGRIAGYLLGRWMGFFILGFFFGWLGSNISGLLTERLIFSFCALLCVFIFLFLATGRSPELILARISDTSGLSLPFFFRGVFSSGTLIATVLIGVALVLILKSTILGMVFFTNFFLGNTLFSLPWLLNIKWSRNTCFYLLIRLILFFCSLSILIFSMASLLKS